MAIIYYTGGEAGIPDFTSYSCTCSTTYKKTGAYSLFFYQQNAQQIFSSKTEIFMSAFLFTNGNLPIGKIVFEFKSGSTSIASLRTDASTLGAPYKLYIGGSSVATGTLNYTSGTWNLIELRLKIHTSGIFHLKINGVDDVIYSGNTAVAGSSSDNFSINSNGSSIFYLDDLVLADTSGSINNTWMGGTKIVMLRPIGPGSLTQWTPSAGANWQCVDEVPMSVTDYVTGDIVGMEDLYDFESLPAGVCSNASILGVKVFNAILRPGITTALMVNVVHTNGSDAVSATITAPATLTGQGTIWELNPITGTTWTYTDVNSIEAGAKIV